MIVSENFLQAFSWTLLHSLWQGALFSLLLLGVLALGNHLPASKRYTVSLMAFIGTMLSACLTFVYQYQSYSLPANSIETENLAIMYSAEDAILPFWERLLAYANSHFQYFLLLWLVGVVIQSIRLTGGLYGIYQIKKQAFLAADSWQEKVNIQAKKMGINRPIRIWLTEKATSPFIIGLWKPLIIMPIGLFGQLSPLQMESILLHELAHIYRYDYYVNLLQCVAEIVLFFNPFLHFISYHIRKEREFCCDDFVLQQVQPPLVYAKALATLEQYRLASYRPALAAADNHFQLLHRIQRMTQNKNHSIRFMQALLSLGTGMLALAALTWLTYQKVYANPQENGNFASTENSDFLPKNSISSTPPDTLKADSIVVNDEGNIQIYHQGKIDKEFKVERSQAEGNKEKSYNFIFKGKEGDVNVQSNPDGFVFESNREIDAEKMEAETEKMQDEIERAEAELEKAEAQMRLAEIDMRHAQKGEKQDENAMRQAEANRKIAEEQMRKAEKDMRKAEREMEKGMSAREMPPFPPMPPLPPEDAMSPIPPLPPMSPMDTKGFGFQFNDNEIVVWENGKKIRKKIVFPKPNEIIKWKDEDGDERTFNFRFPQEEWNRNREKWEQKVQKEGRKYEEAYKKKMDKLRDKYRKKAEREEEK